jgi:hypothetical protein
MNVNELELVNMTTDNPNEVKRVCALKERHNRGKMTTNNNDTSNLTHHIATYPYYRSTANKRSQTSHAYCVHVCAGLQV